METVSEDAKPASVRRRRNILRTMHGQWQACSRFCVSSETDVFTTAKLRLPVKLKELRKPKAYVGTLAVLFSVLICVGLWLN